MYFRASVAEKLYLHKKSGCSDKKVHKNHRSKKYKEDSLENDEIKDGTILK